MPLGYHTRVEGPDSISGTEFGDLQARMSKFAADSHFVYVYSYMKFGKEIRTVTTSATPDEIRDGKETKCIETSIPRICFFVIASRALVEL